MVIVSQNRETIVPFGVLCMGENLELEGISENYNPEVTYHIVSVVDKFPYTIGYYKDEKEAKEVMAKVMAKYEEFLDSDEKDAVFYMP